MKLYIITTLIICFAFQQKEDKNLSETEKIILSVIELNVDLKTKEYIIYNRLVEDSYANLKSSISFYNLSKKDTLSRITHCCLQLINDNEINKFKLMADSINRTIEYPPEEELLIGEKNEYLLIKEKTGKKFCEFSKPLFSKDRKYALIKFNVISGFMFGSFSRTYLMEKRNGVWIENSTLELTDD